MLQNNLDKGAVTMTTPHLLYIFLFTTYFACYALFTPFYTWHLHTHTHTLRLIKQSLVLKGSQYADCMVTVHRKVTNSKTVSLSHINMCC